jgi:hypothetical protein
VNGPWHFDRATLEWVRDVGVIALVCEDCRAWVADVGTLELAIHSWEIHREDKH